ncbi:hypothetical protein [Odoribacter splanchnicus]|uniref:hypothetical protein n=1 Tax=Odoribacter splanchnicus TaxID=28118 RepID=UPI0034AF9836
MKRGIITITDNVVYIPDVPIWMSQAEMADLFGVFGYYIRKAVKNIYKDSALSELETMRCIKIDRRTSMDVYSLEMVIALSYRINSIKADIFRKYLAGRLQSKNK